MCSSMLKPCFETMFWRVPKNNYPSLQMDYPPYPRSGIPIPVPPCDQLHMMTLLDSSDTAVFPVTGWLTGTTAIRVAGVT